jgi:hypothetical protein
MRDEYIRSDRIVDHVRTAQCSQQFDDNPDIERRNHGSCG